MSKPDNIDLYVGMRVGCTLSQGTVTSIYLDKNYEVQFIALMEGGAAFKFPLRYFKMGIVVPLPPLKHGPDGMSERAKNYCGCGGGYFCAECRKSLG